MSRQLKTLHHFIHSLEPVEIRAIRHFSARKSSSKQHVELFDILLKMKRFDEVKLRAKIKTPGLLKNLPKVANYLYHFIFRALAAFGNEPNADLNELMQQVKIAIKKRLYEKGLELIRKAIVLARVRERFAEWLELLKMKRSIYLQLAHTPFLDLELTKIRLETDDASYKLNNLLEYERIEDKVVKIGRLKYLQRGYKDAGLIDHLERHPLLENDSAPASNRAMIKYLSYKFIIEKATPNIDGFVKCIALCKQILEIFDENEYLKIDWREEYFKQISTVCLFTTAIGEFDESFAYLQLLESFRESPGDKLILMDKLMMARISYAKAAGVPQLGIETSNHMRERYEEIFPITRPDISLLLHWRVISFWQSQNNSELAIWWIHKVLDSNSNVRIDIQIWTRIIHLVLLFDLEDWESLMSYSVRHRRFLNKQSEVYECEQVIIRHFARTSSYYSSKKAARNLNELRNELLEIFNSNKAEKYALNYFNILEWIEQKLAHTPSQMIPAKKRQP